MIGCQRLSCRAPCAGLPREQLLGNSLSEVLEATDGTQLPSPALLKAVRDVKGAGVPLARVKDASVTKTFALTFRCGRGEPFVVR